VLGVAMFTNLTELLEQRDFSLYDTFHPTLELTPHPDHTTGKLRATWVGCSTVMLSDGTSAVMSDAFFTRNAGGLRGPGQLFLQPLLTGKPRMTLNLQHINSTLWRLGLAGEEAVPLGAVAVAHSHHDHSMDSGEVCRRTGAMLVGSNSTANIGRGSGLAEVQIQVVELEKGPLRYGRFSIEMIRSRHVEMPLVLDNSIIELLNVSIDRPLSPPASLFDYKEGGSYSILMKHPAGSILVQGSANFIPGALAGLHAGVVYLGIGGLGSKSQQYCEGYWQHVVVAVGAKVVVPVHWDDFSIPLHETMRASPGLSNAMHCVIEQARRSDIKIIFQHIFDPLELP